MRLATLSLLALLLASVATAQTVLVPDASADGDRFGSGVALSGDRALVGADTADRGADATGAAVVFVRDGDGWVQEVELTATDRQPGDRFGFDVALDGDLALVGAAFADSGAGAAYVFRRDASGWTETARLTASDASPGAAFGATVALSGDVALVGAPFTEANLGAAYVFSRSGDAWTEVTRLDPTDGSPEDRFGLSLDLDGTRALVGAPGTDALTGSAYVFEGPTWARTARLDAAARAENDRFGGAVSLSGDRALVGAHRADRGASVTGAAFVFAFDGGAWAEQSELVADDAAAGDFLGRRVVLDGTRAVVGAPMVGDADRGAVYVFSADGGTWSQRDRLTDPDAADGDQFGLTLAVSGDEVLVGAPPARGRGRAVVFTGLPVGAEAAPAMAARLSAPAPNPSARRARLVLTVETPQPVRATLHDVLGRDLAVLLDGPVADEATLTVDTSRLAPGVYGVRVEGATFVEARRLTVAR